MKRALKLEQFKNKKGKWQARFVASNGKNLARSSDSYETQEALIEMLVDVLVEKHLPDIFKDAHGKWRWRYTKDGDTLIMATECYNNLRACIRCAKLVLEAMPEKLEAPKPEPVPEPVVPEPVVPEPVVPEVIEETVAEEEPSTPAE